MKHQYQTLANNVRLITIAKDDTQAATILVMVRAGSRYESRRVNGVSHFVEHIMFKGTKKRPNTLAISKELDGVGAEYNAFTGKDYTGYYIKADVRHLPMAIDVLTDMLHNSLFDAKEIEREKNVIVEEINMYEDNPIMQVEEILEELLFAGNSLGWSIAGSRDNVRGMTRADLVNYRDQYYRGANVVVGLAGNISKKDIALLVKKLKFPASKKLNQFKSIKIDQRAPRVKIQFKETEQVQLALGFPAYGYTNAKLYALQLLSVIVGGNMSSRLFLSVRERNSLAYFIRSGLNVYEDTGAFTVQSGLDKKQIDRALKLIMTELAKAAKSGVTNDELARAKEYIAGKTALNLEDSSNVVQWYVQQELLTNKILTAEQKLAKFMTVTRADVAKVAKEVLVSKRANLAIIGPFKDEKHFADILIGK